MLLKYLELYMDLYYLQYMIIIHKARPKTKRKGFLRTQGFLSFFLFKVGKQKPVCEFENFIQSVDLWFLTEFHIVILS